MTIGAVSNLGLGLGSTNYMQYYNDPYFLQALQSPNYYQLQAQNSEYDFWAGDFCYKILSEADKTVELVQNQTPCWYGYTGKITIPDSVEYNGNYYQVISFGSYVFYGSGISIKFPKGLRNN